MNLFNIKKAFDYMGNHLRNNLSLPSENPPIILYELQEDSQNQSDSKIWTLDPVTFSTSKEISLPNGTLRPVFVLHPKYQLKPGHERRSTATNTEKFDDCLAAPKPRGRSFSPSSTERFRSCESHFDDKGSRGDHRRANFRRDFFRKSFSSDNLDNGSHHTFLSSSCSSTSTASSRSGTCSTRIPLPVNHSERLRFRNRYPTVNRGPLTSDTFARRKLDGFENSPDGKLKTPARSRREAETFSSASESSGYFTPPAEPQLPELPVREEKEPERFIRLNSKPEDEPLGEPVEFIQRATPSPDKSSRSSSCSSRPLTDKEPSFVEIKDEPQTRPQSTKTATSLDELDFSNRRPFVDGKPLAKSEANLKKSPEMHRVGTNSAPAPIYQTFNETTINITLPGAVDMVQEVVETVEIVKKPKTTPEKPPTKRPVCRSLFKRPAETPSFSEDLAPFLRPKEALHEIIGQLESSDWELTINGLRNLVRLKRHHPEHLDGHLHAIVVALVRQIRNLRSQVARAACKAAGELFVGVTTVKKTQEMELEELAAPLLQRTADTNRFLRSDANAALDCMCGALPAPKVVQVVSVKGCGHPNALVRATAARLLCGLAQRLGAEKVFQLPKETRDKLLLMGANMLTDGNLDTRKHAKMMLMNLCSHPQFQRTMFDVIPVNTLRHIEKILKTLK